MGVGSSRRRLSILSGNYALEERVALSSIVHAHPAFAPPRHPAPEVARASQTPVPSVVAEVNHPSPRSMSHAASPTAKRWSWLANTYWYVPTRNLPATLFNSTTGTLAAVSDQTVFHITGYRNGYFWGKVVTQLGSSSASSSSLVGSVTPEGRVLLAFTQTSSSSSPSVTEGYGQMQRKRGQWTMENQMFTSPVEQLQIGHWAYMMQTHPGLPSWNSLPSAGVSVPTFLSEGNSPGPIPIGS